MTQILFTFQYVSINIFLFPPVMLFLPRTLHSNMSLLIFLLVALPIFSSFSFTFQYVSINITDEKRALKVYRSLHSNMSLLISVSDTGSVKNLLTFTFQYVSINIYVRLYKTHRESNFTFQYVSINMQFQP